jgi:hypothetical protein
MAGISGSIYLKSNIIRSYTKASERIILFFVGLFVSKSKIHHLNLLKYVGRKEEIEEISIEWVSFFWIGRGLAQPPAKI